MKTLRKLTLAFCAFMAIASSISCNKEGMQTEKLLGTWDVIMDKNQEYENGVMVKETDYLLKAKENYLAESKEELYSYQYHFSYSQAIMMLNGKIVDGKSYSIINGKLYLFGIEFKMTWEDKNNLKLEGKYDNDEENPRNYILTIIKLSRAK